MAIEISGLAHAVGRALDIATRYAADRLVALITHFAAVQGTTPEAAAEQLGALAVREVVSLVAEGTAEQVKALAMPHDLPATDATPGEAEAQASGSEPSKDA